MEVGRLLPWSLVWDEMTMRASVAALRAIGEEGRSRSAGKRVQTSQDFLQTKILARAQTEYPAARRQASAD